MPRSHAAFQRPRSALWFAALPGCGRTTAFRLSSQPLCWRIWRTGCCIGGSRCGQIAPRPCWLRFVILNVLIILCFLPWLATAVTSVLNWPKGGAAVSWAAGMALTLRTLLFGPLRHPPQPLWPWLAVGALLPLLGLFLLRTRRSQTALGLWLLLPIGLMAVLGLFTPAFLKFLLVTSPAWCLLAAAAPVRLPRAWIGGMAVALFGVALAWSALPAYYADVTARDNYKGIAEYLAAAGKPATDLVVLDAPGQQEVWKYYDPGLSVLALPATRPADAQQVEAALTTATQDRDRVYALLWATDEADPGNLVEGWLDRNAFKGSDAWQGNLRLAVYTFAHALKPGPTQPVAFSDVFRLAWQSQPSHPQTVSAGDAAIVQLTWETSKTIDSNYKVTVQLLDSRNQVIAQRDGEPVGGARPTTSWQPGEQIVDNYALPVPFGTPPGAYRLIMAVYDPTTGRRLPAAGATGDHDALELGQVVVEQPEQAIPTAVIPIQHQLRRSVGPVTLAGYDAYRKDSAHAPETPLRPGDVAQFTFYWVAPDPLPDGWPADQTFTLSLGDRDIEAPLAGGLYPTAAWQPGALVRGVFDLPYDGTANQPVLTVADQTIRLDPLP